MPYLNLSVQEGQHAVLDSLIKIEALSRELFKEITKVDCLCFSVVIPENANTQQ